MIISNKLKLYVAIIILFIVYCYLFKQSNGVIEYFTATKQQTQLNDAGPQTFSNIYLDRHNVNCNNNGLSQFKLVRSSDGNQYQYQYTCSDANGGTLSNKSTPADDNGGGNVIYLNKHNVNCDGKPLTQFKLARSTDGKQNYYNYSCGNIQLQNINNKTTPANDYGSGETVYLDRHNVDCGNQILSDFKLATNNGKINYNYACGDMPTDASSASTGLSTAQIIGIIAGVVILVVIIIIAIVVFKKNKTKMFIHRVQ